MAKVSATVPLPPSPSPSIAQTRSPEQTPLELETNQLAEIYALLHHSRDPAAALAELVVYHHRFPHGTLAVEAAIAEANADLALGRTSEALEMLEGLQLPEGSREQEVGLLRAELLTEADRCPEALPLFERVLHTTSDEGLLGRGSYGRAICLTRTGQPEASRDQFRSYLARFPTGSFAPQARRALNLSQ